MYAIAALSKIVRNDARIEVKVPATQGRKAYSYFREGVEEEKGSPRKSSRKIAAGVGGAITAAGLVGLAAIYANRKKTSEKESVIAAKKPDLEVKVADPKKRSSNIVRNTAIGRLVAARVGKGLYDYSKREKKTKEPVLEEDLGISTLSDDPDTAKSLGEGAFGTVSLTKNGTAFKKMKLNNPYGLKSIDENEIRLSYEAGEKGLGPKVLGIRRDDKKNIVGYEMEMLDDHKTLATALIGHLDNVEGASKSFDNALVAVAKLHDAGIIHCDLNAFNLMESKGKVKAIDFGLSVKFEDRENPSESDLMRWKGDLLKMDQTYTRNTAIQKPSPIQRVMKETLSLAEQGNLKAYKYYKQEMAKHV